MLDGREIYFIRDISLSIPFGVADEITRSILEKAKGLKKLSKLVLYTLS